MFVAQENHAAVPASREWPLVALLISALAPLERFPRRDPLSPVKNAGLEKQWSTAACETASIGLSGVDEVQATSLLADLMPYPRHSRASSPRSEQNTNWFGHALVAVHLLAKKEGLPTLTHQASPEGASPYPPGFAAARIAALGRLGADPDKARALLRATFRKSREEVLAVLALPGCPSPGRSYPNTGSPLHRASYQGPNDLFCLLARASSAEDWARPDDQGRLPADLAHQSGNFGRTLASAELTPFHWGPKDPDGRGPLHRLAARVSGSGFQPMTPAARTAWAGSFGRMAHALGADAFFEPDSAGLTPVDLAGLPGLRDIVMGAQATAAAREIDSGSAASTAVPAARLRL